MAVEFYTWVDRIAADLEQRGPRHVLHGEWTPSGFFHIGNSRAELLMQALVRKALEEKNVHVTHNFLVDDFDDFDKVPAGFDASFSDYLGLPLRNVPSPEKKYDSWADFLAFDIVELAELYGAEPEIVSLYDAYHRGVYDDAIRIVLDKSSEVRAIWNRVTGGSKPEGWIAVMPVCGQCGRNSTTVATSWDGRTLAYACSQDRPYRRSCGFTGEIKPGKGNVKLPWRVHWAANWFIFGTTFEPAGKDHFTKGGSVDTSRAFCREIFGKEPPLQIPCEFIQLGGKKISGSKGNVITLRDWLAVAEPELLRFMIASYQPNTAIEFDMEEKFLLLVQRYEDAGRAYFEPSENKRAAQLRRQYELAHIRTPEKPLAVPYEFAALIAQLEPFSDTAKATELLKATGHIQSPLDEREEERLSLLLERARAWVGRYAPDMKLAVQDRVPGDVKEGLSGNQKKAMRMLSDRLHAGMKGDDVYTSFYEIAKEANLQSSEFFRAAYQTLIGRPSGPRLAHLIMSIGLQRSKRILAQV